MIKAIIFDFDGVIADTERLANLVLAEAVTGLGVPTSLDDALDRYQGKRWADVAALIEESIARAVPEDFGDRLQLDTLARFRTDLREVEGAVDFIRRFAAMPQCIASSSSPDRLALCLELLGLADHFEGRVFSADQVARGKPHPDIFLHAAARIAADPAQCIVIEDSPSGVRGAVAAGMTVIGLCAASHLRDGHADRLTEAGATWTAADWNEVARLIGEMASSR